MNNKSNKKTILTCPNDHSIGRVTKSTTGFAMLFAVLISSFLIMIGISIFSISLKEVMISTSIRDSQMAFYAVDSAGECALYWDLKGGGTNSAFPSCTDLDCSNHLSGEDIPTTITCNGITNTLSFIKNNLTYSYSGNDFFRYSSSTIDTEPEADITISKTLNGTKITTTFNITGHNTGESGRRVERGIIRIY